MPLLPRQDVLVSGVIELGGGSTTAKAISLDNVDFAIDGKAQLAHKHRLELSYLIVNYNISLLKWCSIPVAILIIGVV